MIVVVGLMVPHLAHAAVKICHVTTLPIAALGGAVLMLVADSLRCALLSGQELLIAIIVCGLGGRVRAGRAAGWDVTG